MIVVIADDYTGAAEIAGIGLRYNLKVEMSTVVNLRYDADLLVIATDTRSLPIKEALAKTVNIAQAIKNINPEFVFKKVDSVLRGYVAEELKILISRLGKKGALLVPANPQSGRTITDGIYSINNQPLHLTNFGDDPEFPAKSSSVVHLLSGKDIHISHSKATEAVNLDGITIGDAVNKADLEAWANKFDDQLIMAGAAGFFSALLEQHFGLKVKTPPSVVELMEPMLIISGTAVKKSSEAIKALKADCFPVAYMPLDVVEADIDDDGAFGGWQKQIVTYIANFGKAIIAINPDHLSNKTNQAVALRQKTAAVVKLIFQQVAVKELMIEGGSTAAAVFKQLGITKFYPGHELAPGVLRMSAAGKPGLNITLKPGSYAWPQIVTNYTLY